MSQYGSEVLPRVFGKYHLIERIATGGMAELYRAKLYGAGGFEKDLAIKKVLPHLVSDTAFVQMFMDEAMITVTLNHGNIVSVIDFGEIDGEYYLVMEFVDGVNLQSLIHRSNEASSPFPVSIACHIAHEICRGLDYAHRKVGADGRPLNIVHRDISPQNILISFEGEVKIADFGIARAASRITSTQAGVLKGKVAYMSPEQLLGQPVDNRSDIFAAANILYEMLTNRRPFEGFSPHETMALITHGVYTKPNKYNSKIPKRLSAVVIKALEKNLKKRYRTAGEMAADLAAFLHDERLYLDASTVAAFISTRLPDSRPKTVQPTPIRTIRREARALESTPITVAQKRTTDSRTPEPFLLTPKTEASQGTPPRGQPSSLTQESSEPVEPQAKTISMEAVSEPNSEKQGDSNEMQNGEAVAFDILGLPQYSPEPTDSRRQTAPNMKAVGSEPKPIDSQSQTQPPQAGSDLDSKTRIMQAVDVDEAPTTIKPPADVQPSREIEQPPPHQTATRIAPIQSRYSPEANEVPGVNADHTMLLDETRSLDDQYERAKPSPVKSAALSEYRTVIGNGADFHDDYIEHAAGLGKKKFNPMLIGGISAAVVVIVLIIVALAWPSKTRPTTSTNSETTNPSLTTSATSDLTTTKPLPDKNQATAETSDAATTVKDANKDSENPSTRTVVDVAAKPNAAKLDSEAELTHQPPAPNVDNRGVEANKPENLLPHIVKPQLNENVIKPTVASTGARIETTPKPAAGKGILRVNAEPFAIVYADNKRIGPTPQLNIELPAGSHTIVLKNDALGITKRVGVRIDAQKVQTIFIELTK